MNVASGGDEARRRFADALYDDTLQLLTAAEIQLQRLRLDLTESPYAARLAELQLTVKQLDDSLRELLVKVSPLPFGSQGRLADAIQDRLQRLRTHTGIEPDTDLQLRADVTAATGSVVFKTVDEALTNVERHARATRVRVTAIASDGGIRVEVTDNGAGFVVRERESLAGHAGLVTMTERVHLKGGWFRIESEPGAGTSLKFWIPIGN